MMPRLDIKRLAWLGWGVINAALVVAIGTAWQHDERLRHRVPGLPAAAPVETVLHPEFRLPARDKAFDATLERPLFVPSRREAPPVPPPPPPPPPTMKKGQFQLLGTIITDEVRIAVVREIASGKERQVHQGYIINGLQLETVEPHRIVFSQYDDREEVRLKIQPSPRPAAAQAAGQPGKAGVLPGAPAQGAASVAPARAVQPAGVSRRPGAVEAPAARPVAPPAPPQTIEDRRRNPLLKDFYK